MAKVHLVNDATAWAVHMEVDSATPIVPLNAVVLQFPAPQAIDEWEIPPAPLSIAVIPEVAIELAVALYQAAREAQRET